MTREGKPQVGSRLRAFREQQGWSLRTLSKQCGLSINAISRIERGENSPTISSLNRLAQALSVPITDFFLERPQEVAVLQKHGLARRVQQEGFLVEHLCNGNHPQMEPFLVTLDPDCESLSHPINHPGSEFVHCFAGQVEYCVDDEVFLLDPGDSLLFDAMHPHHCKTVNQEPARLLIVFQAARDNSLARLRHSTD